MSRAHPTPAEPGPSDVRVLARAVTMDGQPVREAWLAVRFLAAGPAHGDGEGRLELSLPALELERFVATQEGRTVELEVGAPGLATERRHRRIGQDARVIELGDVMLPAGGEVYGRVVDAGGLGLEGAEVVFGSPVGTVTGSENHARLGPRDLRVPADSSAARIAGTSGPGGAFRLAGVRAGHGTLWARTSTSLWTHSEPIGVRAGEEVGEVVLVVHEAPERTIAGLLVDSEDRAVPGSWVRFRATGNDRSSGSVQTDAAGRFRYITPDAAAQDVHAASPSSEWEDALADAVPAGTHDLVLAFQPAQWLVVTVHDEEGLPIVSGTVTGLRADDPRRAFPRSESSLDPQGRALLRRPAEPLLVRVAATGYRDAQLGPFDPLLFPDPLVAILQQEPALVGRVLLADGSPAAGARVGLHRGALPGQASGNWTHSGWAGTGDAFVHELLPSATAQSVADGEGRFRLPLPGRDGAGGAEVARAGKGLPGLGSASEARQARPAQSEEAAQRLWYVHAALAGHATATAGPLALDSRRDPHEELELVLTTGGAIAGRLVLEDGGEPVGWTARASDGLAQIVEAAVASDGSFHLANLHAGGWQVRAFEPSAGLDGTFQMETDRMAEPDVVVLEGRTSLHELRASARPRARLLGRLQIDGRPPGPWLVSARSWTPPRAISMVATTLDPEGRFEVRMQIERFTSIGLRPPPGSDSAWNIAARPELVPGDNPWAFDLETSILAGHVDPARIPARSFHGASYEAVRDGVTVRVSLSPDAEGRFGPLPVPSGPGILRGPSAANDVSGGPIWAELDLRGGESRMLDLR